MNLCIIGTGFVGVVSAAVFASFGNQVIGLDVDEKKVEKLKKGVVPFYEPGLSELLVEQQAAGHLSFTTDYKTAISQAEVILVSVGTPSAPDGQADLKYVMMSAESMAPYLQPEAIVAIKSTVPPGTLKKVSEHIEKVRAEKKLPELIFHTASLPEFLKEGTAVQDTLHPDRIVIGARQTDVFKKLADLHAPFEAPIVHVTPESAQMAKYAANAYLATRITFINQIADLCEKNGADIQDVVEAIGYDKRIGKHYWYPGFGYGGSCFPKDVKELAAYSRAVGEDNNLLNKINEINEERVWKLLDEYGNRIGGWSGKKVAVLGLSFKPNTDDMREAPSTKVIPYLLNHDANVHGFDPKATEVVQFFIPEHPHAKYTTDINAAVKDTDVIVALVEWPEIIGHDFSLTGGTKSTEPDADGNSPRPWFIDARNQFSPQKVKAWGFHYIGVGR